MIKSYQDNSKEDKSENSHETSTVTRTTNVLPKQIEENEKTINDPLMSQARLLRLLRELLHDKE